MHDHDHEASPAYALGQLSRAMHTAQEHADPQTRERARTKAAKWTAVLEGMAEGTLRIGSRTPVAQTPAWVTLEVAHGGFSTGRYLAEGELREHEQTALAQLSEDVPGNTERERLNLYYSSDAGGQVLLTALREDRYEVEVPEEAALVVAAWLLEEGHGDLALELICELRPLMHRLRFYPRLLENRRRSVPGVHLATAGEIVEQLRRTKSSSQVMAMNATLSVWNPLYDSLVSLWLQTVEGDVPRLGSDGTTAEGGVPGRVWPSTWTESRETWLARYRAALVEHNPTGRHHNRRGTFQRLLGFLEQCPAEASTLRDGDISSLRHQLACAVSRHGHPQHPASSARRDEQARIAALPLHDHIAHTLANRLTELPPNEGIASLDIATLPVREDEHRRVAPGTPIPPRFVDKAKRAWVAPIDELVACGVIGSSEVLAQVAPQITAQVAAAGIDDPRCADLFSRTYSAFRRRRSLLLLNLEHQVTIEELPWVAALQRFRTDDLGTARLSLQTLRSITLLTLEHFPHTIIPNPLLQEMVALSQRAGLKLPFVEEIAADIFMGTFTAKFGEAAEIASQVLNETLYARYYSLPPATPPERPRKLLSRWGKKTDLTFDQRCVSRAGEAGDGGGSVARNGAVLEQCQILTSYNLAVLVRALDLQPELRVRGAALATQALRWVLDRQSRLPVDYLPRLRTTKNTAYAWRQAIFYLSFATPDEQQGVVATFAEQLAQASQEVQTRLEPAIAGLRLILSGGRFDDKGFGDAGQRRFLGWSCGRHWMLPAG